MVNSGKGGPTSACSRRRLVAFEPPRLKPHVSNAQRRSDDLLDPHDFSALGDYA
jgi:hypothetical protein